MVERICKCGTQFEVRYPSSARTNCSAKCRGVKTKTRADAGLRKADWVTKICRCGATGEVPPWRGPKAYYCSLDCTKKYRPASRGRKPSPDSLRRVERDGYVKVYVPLEERPPGQEHVSHHKEHRVVMARMLGRHLLPGENVHHINGHKGDNSPENLELWISKQPRGQRVADLLAFAHEVIERYEKPAKEI